ncbi:MAG: metal ABC transporter permease, partial [Rickettsiales bacterium]
MFDDFFLRGLMGGIGVAILAGPLGCFVVWQRMSYFGAAIAHAALLGVALGFVLEVDPLVGVLLVSVLFAGGIAVLQSRTILASDTILGIFAHISLALGIVAIGFMETLRVDLMGYLFGDILA